MTQAYITPQIFPLPLYPSIPSFALSRCLPPLGYNTIRSECSHSSFCSLNKTKRQRELLIITHENQAILKRILSKEPHYHHRQWFDEWRVNILLIPTSLEKYKFIRNMQECVQERGGGCPLPLQRPISLSL